jgi:Protein of unknown function (DUF2442)
LQSALTLAASTGLSATQIKEAQQLAAVHIEEISMPGTLTSQVEVTQVSQHGFWLLLGDEELFLPFADFPWFRGATIEQLCDIEWPAVEHLFWPSLDIDLAVESIRNSAAFPLIASANTPKRAKTDEA